MQYEYSEADASIKKQAGQSGIDGNIVSARFRTPSVRC